MKPSRRPSVSLVTENRDVLMNVRPLISGGPFLSLRCSARVRHCLCMLVGVVDTSDSNTAIPPFFIHSTGNSSRHGTLRDFI